MILRPFPAACCPLLKEGAAVTAANADSKQTLPPALEPAVRL